MIYFDTSALLKTIRTEPETLALRKYLQDRPGEPQISSALLRAEVARTIKREAGLTGEVDPQLVAVAQRAIGQLMLWRVSDDILQATWEVPGTYVRALDAIHVATAQRINQFAPLSAFVTYDQRQAEAAQAVGLNVDRPAP